MIWMNVLKFFFALVVLYVLYKLGFFSKLFKWLNQLLVKLDGYNRRNNNYNKDLKARRKYIDKMVKQMNRSDEL